MAYDKIKGNPAPGDGMQISDEDIAQVLAEWQAEGEEEERRIAAGDESGDTDNVVEKAAAEDPLSLQRGNRLAKKLTPYKGSPKQPGPNLSRMLAGQKQRNHIADTRQWGYLNEPFQGPPRGAPAPGTLLYGTPTSSSIFNIAQSARESDWLQGGVQTPYKPNMHPGAPAITGADHADHAVIPGSYTEDILSRAKSK